MPAKSSGSKPKPDPWSYEETVATVEAIIADLESGQLPLAEVLSQFEQAVQSLQECEVYLNEKQQQVDVLIETLTDG
ncbi:MAG: exodeoxyribonuclease VII small subunit [Leptolyngbyaceae cyanobacterium SM2_3_12]|nr:exodeoxyribonuclease VII small subunit [Leptolyngbyaceae cyanobacterium SM2_3_12]